MGEGINFSAINIILIVIGGIVVAVAAGGIVAGLMAFNNYLKGRKAEVERAYQQLPPEQQAKINDVVAAYNEAIKTVRDIVGALVQLGQLGADLTDGDPNTPSDPDTLLAAANKLEEKAKVIRTAALSVKRVNNTALGITTNDQG